MFCCVGSDSEMIYGCFIVLLGAFETHSGQDLDFEGFSDAANECP